MRVVPAIYGGRGDGGMAAAEPSLAEKGGTRSEADVRMWYRNGVKGRGVSDNSFFMCVFHG